MNYNKNKPLVYIHIPKCAGSSVKPIFKKWYGTKFSQFYRIGGAYKLQIDAHKKKSLVFGHFNSKYGLSVDKIFPDVDQYMTMLREPLDTHISAFFYYKKRFSGRFINPPIDHIAWLFEGMFSKKTREIIKAQRNWINSYNNVEDWVENEPLNYANHLPSYINKNNLSEIFKEKFVCVGLFDDIEKSMKKFSTALNKNYVAGSIKKKNVGSYVKNIDQGLVAKFISKNDFAYSIYEEAKLQF